MRRLFNTLIGLFSFLLSCCLNLGFSLFALLYLLLSLFCDFLELLFLLLFFFVLFFDLLLGLLVGTVVVPEHLRVLFSCFNHLKPVVKIVLS